MKFCKCKSALFEDSSLTVLANTTSSGVKSCGRPNGDAFFAGGNLHILVRQATFLVWNNLIYHIEAQSTLPLCLEHDHIHNANYIRNSRLDYRNNCTCLRMDGRTSNIFLYHVSTSSSVTSVPVSCSHRQFAIRVHHSIRRHRRVGGRALERKLGCKLAVHGTWEMYTKRVSATKVARSIVVLLV